MANGIPPFLPASPPPMCQLDYSGDEDEDEFGDFSNAANNGYSEENVPSEDITTTNLSKQPKIVEVNSIKSVSNNDVTLFPTPDLSESTHISSTTEDLDRRPDKSSSPTNSINETVEPEKSDPSSDLVSVAAESNDEETPPPEAPVNVPEISINESDVLSSIVSNDAYCDIAKHSSSEDDSDSEDICIPDCFITDEQSIREHMALDEPLPSVNIDKVIKDYGSTLDERTVIQDTEPQVQEDEFSGIEFDDFVSCSFNDKQVEQTQDEQFAEELEFNFFINNKAVVATDLDEKTQEKVLDSFATLDTKGQPEEPQTVDEEDDFSDFVSTSVATQVNSESLEPFSEYSSSDFNSETNSVNVLEVNAALEMDNLEYWHDVFRASSEEQIEVNLNTLEGRLNGSSIWLKIKDIESSPALSYTWSNSETNKILLSALYVDSRNILFGPRWSSEVPRFASNLGFSPLIPQKASSKNNVQNNTLMDNCVDNNKIFSEPNNTAPQIPAIVPDAHFDWNNSGLTNPLDSCKSEKNKDENRSQPSSNSSLFGKFPNQKELSSEAKEVLSNLPNLCVMEKQYIVFPIN